MRVISGTAKGRVLFAPKTRAIRPATDKVKEALFNILGSVEGTRVLDLFAGSGSVAIEALSRGAVLAVFVDDLPEALRLIRRNLEACGFLEKSRIVKGRIPSILSRIRVDHPFHYVFVDPPYDQGLLTPTMEKLITYKLIDAQTWVIIEHSPREMPDPPGFNLIDRRQYGQTFLSFFQEQPQCL